MRFRVYFSNFELKIFINVENRILQKTEDKKLISKDKNSDTEYIFH